MEELCILSPDEWLDLFKNSASNGNAISVLRSADNHFKTIGQLNSATKWDFNSFEAVANILSDNFMSSSHSIRLLTASVLCRLQNYDDNFQLNMDSAKPGITIFDIIFTAESIFPMMMDNYRDRLLYLRKLSFDECSRYMPWESTSKFSVVPLKMLIGQLHVNFALTWDPMVDLIETHVRGLGNVNRREDARSFWQFFVDKVIRPASEKVKITATVAENENVSSDSVDDDRPDPLNFRYLLWKVLEKCSLECVEWNSRHLSPLILDLAETEINLFDADPEKQRGQNLVDNVNLDDGNRSVDGTVRRGTSLQIKTLIVMLRTYSRFRDIKSTSKEPALRDLYYKLLMHKRDDVQKAALECVFAYKSKNLSPYREYFDQLLDDKKFRDALTLFQIDSEGQEQCVVDPKHRVEVIPVLIRILYGRMLGKAGRTKRKAPIFNFLAGCMENELNEFLSLLLVPVSSLMTTYQGSLLQQCEWIIQNYDLRQSVDLKKLLSVYSNLHVVFRKLSYLFTDESKSRFWRLLMITSAIIERLRNEKQSTSLEKRYWRIVKELNKRLLTLLVDFFTCFGDDFNLASNLHADDLKVLFITTCSQSNLERLSSGGVNMASGGLLSLFSCWSQNVRLVPFLDLRLDTASKTALHACVQLLLHPGCTFHVQNRILVILRDVSLISYVRNEHGVVKDGVQILQPLVTDLLAYMRQKLVKTGKGLGTGPDQKKAKEESIGILSELDLQLLSKLSACVSEATESESLTELLLPSLGSKKLKSPSAELDTLVTLRRLVKNIRDCSRFNESITRLFSIIKFRESRTALCELWYAAFVEDRRASYSSEVDWEKWQFMAKVIRDWNSWDEKRVEEPDFGRRTSAYYDVKRRIDNGDLSTDICFARLILHDCTFVVLESDDISLRDNACYTIRKLIEAISTSVGDIDRLQFVNANLLPILKRGLKSKSEAVRLEFVAILASAARSFSSHPRFIGLDSLAPANCDPDADFFENLRHIQLHRRARALRRLSEKLERQAIHDDSTSKISSETVYLYLLPIFLPWPYVDAVIKHQSSLIEEVVRCLTAYCRHQAPWKRYESLLKYFLTRLQKDPDKQKITVKLLTGILDGFRCDLTNVNDAQPLTTNDDQHVVDSGSNKSNDGAGKKLKIFNSLTKYLIPQLQKAISKPLQTEMVHKIMQKAHYDEDEQILRIPIALALVKLMKRLPIAVLESNLAGILYKVCQMLKSRSLSIRESTRKTLYAMATELGPRYLPFIMKEMRSILTRGYQIHVLIFTIHGLLSSLSDVLVTGDLDPCLEDILEICNEDLFGEASEQKEVEELTKGLKESKAQKTYVTYGVLGSLISVGYLDKALFPLKKMLETNHSYKTLTRLKDALRHFAIGLSKNNGLGAELSLIFIHRTLTEFLPMVLDNSKIRRSGVDEVEQDPPVRLKSCLILDPEPGRTGATSTIPKTSRTNNFHVLVEFALETLFLTLKNMAKLDGESDDARNCQKFSSMLDPFVDLLYKCSTTVHTQTVALALRCLSHLAKWHSDTLPSFNQRDLIKKLLDRLFILLNQYAGLGRAASVNTGREFAASAEVLAMTFKMMAVLIQDVEECQLNADQLRLLLHYIDEDLLDRHRQAAAFSLIRAILTRKYKCEKDSTGNDLLTTIMQRIRDMSIVNQADHVRVQCRQLSLKHAVSYGLLEGKKSRQHLEFYCAQLSYEYEDGRISALESLNSLFDCVEQKPLNRFGSMVFIFLAMRLIHDESAKFKKLVAVTLKNLICKLDLKEVDTLFAMVLAWMQDEKIAHKQLGAHLIALFADVEGEKFHGRLSLVLPAISAELVRLRDENYSLSSAAGEDNEQEELSMDRLLYIILLALRKICDQCPSILRQDVTYLKWMNQIWENVKSLLRYPHQWVQLMSNQLFGVLFATYKPEELSPHSSKTIQSQEFLMVGKDDMNDESSGNIWRTLSESFIGSLRLPDCQADLAEQVIKNLIFVARVIMHNGSSIATSEKLGGNDCSLYWLSARLVRLCRMEISKTPRIFTKRSCVFKWIAAVALNLESKEQFDEWLPVVLPCLYREITLEENGDSEIKQLASEVCDVLKRKAGLDEYSRHWVLCQRSLTEKRAARKRKIAEEAVANPEASAHRKIHRQKKKAESRKRKWANFALHGGKKPRRTKVDKDINDVNADD